MMKPCVTESIRVISLAPAAGPAATPCPHGLGAASSGVAVFDAEPLSLCSVQVRKTVLCASEDHGLVAPQGPDIVRRAHSQALAKCPTLTDEMFEGALPGRIKTLEANDGRLWTLTHCLAAGSAGKFSLALDPDHKLVAAKQVWVDQWEGDGGGADLGRSTQATSIDGLTQELTAQKTCSPELGPYAQLTYKDKHVIISELAASNISNLMLGAVPPLTEALQRALGRTVFLALLSKRQQTADVWHHNDVHPDNVFLMPSGMLTLGDYGRSTRPSIRSQDPPVQAAENYRPPEAILSPARHGSCDAWGILRVALDVLYFEHADLKVGSNGDVEWNKRESIQALVAYAKAYVADQDVTAVPMGISDLEMETWHEFWQETARRDPELADFALRHMVGTPRASITTCLAFAQELLAQEPLADEAQQVWRELAQPTPERVVQEAVLRAARATGG